MYLCVRGIHFASVYDISIRFENCSDSVVFFVCWLSSYYSKAEMYIKSELLW